MVVGWGVCDFWVPASRSLKEKRGVVRSLIRRTQNTFNVSIAEIGDLDHWNKTRIGFALVGNDHGFINAKMDHLLHFIDALHLAERVQTKTEIQSFADVFTAAPFVAEKYGDV